MFKYIIIIHLLLHSANLFSQNENGEYSLGISTGVGYIPFSGTMNKHLKPTMGGSLSLDLYKNKWAYYLSMNGTWTKLRQDIPIYDNQIWNKNSENTIFSYGLSTGYSIYNKGRFRITPFAGLMLTQSRPAPSDLKEYDHLKKYDVGPTFTPDLGLNMTFHLKNTDSQNYKAPSYSPDTRVSINARITCVPFAVRNKELPYKGSIWYLAIGVSMEIFTKD